MANVRNPLLKSTATLVSGTPVVNIEKCLGIQKSGTALLVFIFDYNKTEKNIVWEFANATDRNNEYTALTVASDDWLALTDKAFVSSSAATYVATTGKASTTEDAINLNAVTSLGTDAKKNFLGDGGETIYSIVFNFDAIDSIKTMTWDYKSSVTRDAVLAELAVEAADLVFLA